MAHSLHPFPHLTLPYPTLPYRRERNVGAWRIFSTNIVSRWGLHVGRKYVLLI
ncbi:MAG: hypothetical protein LBS09_04335 [Bacteroidales bacterium]|nr:hypothetical protein [Bacteroidales bacterium]